MGVPEACARHAPGEHRVAVLGAGIAGCSAALSIARSGASVTLIDQRAQPMEAASRWNEGKIHLGYLYGRDRTLRTAERLVPGGLAFAALVHDLTGRDVRDTATAEDDIILIHRDSVTSADEYWAYANHIGELAREHPDAAQYFVDLRDAVPRRLTSSELGALTDSPSIVAGVACPERSVPTTVVADAFATAVMECDRIEGRYAERVLGVTAAEGGGWLVLTSGAASGGGVPEQPPHAACAVVNCLWEGRPVIDAAMGLAPPARQSHRYRLAVFAQAKESLAVRSAVIGVGPFGDVKNYDGSRLYASWYPVGLRTSGTGTVPPAVPELEVHERDTLIISMLDTLRAYLPQVPSPDALAWADLQGGWVYATEEGDLADPQAGLHRRDDVGITQMQSYVSVNTGKYSLGPALGTEAAQRVLGSLRS